ncbi:hypothetical protein G6514_010399 [Epicoccum nigrum]|nr:hypothetical protein G6514_010399 [Epicoccum nigrum]
MSGIEIAGLVTGVLPLLVELVKSYFAISRRAHTFRHYGKAVKSLSTQLYIQSGLFMNEVRLLLLCVEDEAVVEDMLADASDPRWTSDELGQRLHLVLGDNFIICRNIIEEISEMIADMRKDLEQFDVFWDRKSKEKDLRIERHVSKLHSIFDAMRCDVEDALDITDQTRLAHRTSRAILQYNDTPWLTSRWRLRDMKYFGLEDDLSEDAQKTLHVSSELSPPKVSSTMRCHMKGVQGTQDTVSDEIRYGINNMILFFLGVALLEIAHWKPIEDQMTIRDLNDEVFAARRIASQPTQLGPVYHKIAQKCLQGNFGTELDLG